MSKQRFGRVSKNEIGCVLFVSWQLLVTQARFFHFFAGVCEYCVFPYYDEIYNQTEYDCQRRCSAFGCRFTCPVALYKDSLKPVVPPYEWPCPQAADDLFPTCLEGRFSSLLGKQNKRKLSGILTQGYFCSEKHVYSKWNCTKETIPAKNAIGSSEFDM